VRSPEIEYAAEAEASFAAFDKAKVRLGANAKALRDYAKGASDALARVYGAAARDSLAKFGSALGPIDYKFVDPATYAYASRRGAELIGFRLDDPKDFNSTIIPNPNSEWSIDATTRNGVNEMLERAIEEGMSYQEFGDELMNSYLFSETRADMIARTELGIAENKGHVSTFGQLGFTRVEVIDGGGDNPCEECEGVNGDEWPIAQADAEPLEHPNCTRMFLPIEDSLTDSEEEAA
jgi:hypothetical protein